MGTVPKNGSPIYNVWRMVLTSLDDDAHQLVALMMMLIN
jgi:hypothetical protein